MHAIALRLPLLLVAGLPIQAFAADTQPVSYTHLRAHETDS